MLLRRVISHVRNQEWTAIAIDLVIVVVGVFIGIQVANWNDLRNEHWRAHGYLERMRADLDADIANFRQRIGFWKTVQQYGRAGLAYAEGDRSKEQQWWDLVLAYFQASQVAEFATQDTTFRELTSAGDLDLVTDVELRNSLALYYAMALSAQPALTERPRYREHIRGIVPIDVQDHVWANCFRTNSHSEQELPACPSPIEEERAEQIVAEISSNRELMAELRYWISTLQVATLIATDRIANAQELRAEVDAEIARSLNYGTPPARPDGRAAREKRSKPESG